MRLGELLGEYRKRKGLNKNQLAAKLKKSFAAWQSVETGRAEPLLKNLIQIGKVLGFEVLLRAEDRTYVLVEKGGKVVTQEAPQQTVPQQLQMLAQVLSPNELDKLWEIASVHFDAQKKRKMRAG